MALEHLVIGPHPKIDKESVKSALSKMKKDEASRTSAVLMGVLLASGDPSLEKMTSLFNLMLQKKIISTK